MFLGGPLDHTTREVEVERNGCPTRETVIVPSGVLSSDDDLRSMNWTYRRIRVSVGRVIWWIYLLDGHQPPAGHLLNTMPAYLKEKTP